jgi:squalene-hopene/tetraprenyl-beta-curcumene cyclase
MKKKSSSHPDEAKRLASLLVALRPDRATAPVDVGGAARALRPDSDSRTDGHRNGVDHVATFTDAVEGAMARAGEALLELQKGDGHWIYPFEADCTIPAEYVIMMHHLGDIDEGLQKRLARYLRKHQQQDTGGWPLYYDGEPDLSCSVKAYWALKLAGDQPHEPHMVKARERILSMGGAARSNGFTRSLLARMRQVPWHAVPFTPVELMLLPRWFPLHFSRMSYWARAVLVPMTVIHSLRAEGVNPTGIDVRELFVTPPEKERYFGRVRGFLNRLFLRVERPVRKLEPMIPRRMRSRALKRAEKWFVERLNGVDGLGGVFPSMVNSLEAMIALGYPEDHPHRVAALKALQLLLVEDGEDAYCQPCVSPVWDTALAGLALHEMRLAKPDERIDAALERAGDWLRDRQVLDGPADWRISRPNLAPGGWPFQYGNDFYPDIDDTCAVVWALHHIDPARYEFSIHRGLDWVVGMQSSNGGFAAFDVDNDSEILQALPFGDSGPLLDPPTADVSGRAVTAFALCGRSDDERPMEATIHYLLDEQEETGAWFGRWGSNYIYGTWSVMMALELVQDDERVAKARERAADWVESVQQEDGGWGESNDSYDDPSLAGGGQPSTSYQTAWALLSLMAAGRTDSVACRRGIAWLVRNQESDGVWREPWFSAPGFPKIFYLRYLGYSHFFPLWALARFRRELGEFALGHAANGVETNGHGSNGHGPNGHGRNGNGHAHAGANGSKRSHGTNGHGRLE